MPKEERQSKEELAIEIEQLRSEAARLRKVIKGLKSKVGLLSDLEGKINTYSEKLARISIMRRDIKKLLESQKKEREMLGLVKSDEERENELIEMIRRNRSSCLSNY